MPKYFVFFHVGAAAIYPTILVRSIKRSCPNAYVIQCSDCNTPKIPGVDEYKIVEARPDNLMISRLRAFAGLNLKMGAAYIDTDMVFLGDVDPEVLLQGAQVSVCRRTFNRDVKVNVNPHPNLDISEYTGMTWDEVYPYVACFTVTEDSGFWSACVEELEKTHDKFHFWFGDQEAIRNVIKRNAFEFSELPECIYACLPEKLQKQTENVKVLHFKGAQRKKMMVDFAVKHGLVRIS